jgi:hypothetical protein
VLIMQRLHEDDLVGHVLAQEDWEIVRLQAIAEEDETIVVDSLLGKRCFERRRGEALHPAREPLALLAQIRRTIGRIQFRRPVPADARTLGRRPPTAGRPTRRRARGQSVVSLFALAKGHCGRIVARPRGT